MSDKMSMTLRLDPSLHERLRVVAELREESMAEVVREALESELPRMAAREAQAVEARLRRLLAVMEEQPDLVGRSITDAARAEVEIEDPLEDEAVLESEGSESSDLTSRVRKSFAGLG